MEMKLPFKVEVILKTLNQHGYKAYVVGGCVRNFLLSLPAKDWDITTSAPADEVVKMFDKVIPTGLKHGTVTVVVDGEHFEVTTFRKDGVYLDARRPDDVTFTRSLVEDLARRDFTMNAIAFNPEEGFVDPFNGVEDTDSSLVRTVGLAKDRFKEDPLRMMRAFRFVAQYNMILDSGIEKAVKKESYRILMVSKERVQDELNKILLGEYCDIALIQMQGLGLLKMIIPEIEDTVNFKQNNVNHNLTVFEHLIASVSYVDNNSIVAKLAALLHDIGKPLTYTEDEKGGHFYGHDRVSTEMARTILTRLKYSNEITGKVEILIANHMARVNARKPSNLKKFIIALGEENLPDLFALMRADCLASAHRSTDSADLFREQIQVTLKSSFPRTIVELDVDGNDLAEAGIPRNKEMGRILKKLMDSVLNGVLPNEKSVLVRQACLIYEEEI